MKKVFTVVIIGAVVAAGFFFFIKSPVSPSGNNSAATVADIIMADNQNAASDHIRTANIKDMVDATGKQKVNVDIGDFFFKPTVLKVRNGTTVTWTNNGMIGHDVKSDKSSPKQGPSSQLLGRGEEYSFTFDEPGLYLYYCSPHPSQMRAVIEVVE